MSSRRILVVEDDAAIRTGLVDALRFHGFEPLSAADGDQGMELAQNAECDLILLDLVLPGRQGLEILAEVRASRPTLPVIVLTAKGEEADRITGLRLGADDYVVKPFSIRELVARIEAVMRRSPERPSDITHLSIGAGHVNLARREVRFGDGKRAELSEREAELLEYLARHRGRAISRDEILARVWRIEPRGTDTRTIDMHITRLREKLRDDPASPRIILTVRGKGYMFA
ncbi:MAG TPA: response regulator transcription factor [Tepidisphaeraceae bacterium]|nr:response regulator transcription factor [Tepidisphaeraceae bacterium]